MFKKQFKIDIGKKTGFGVDSELITKGYVKWLEAKLAEANTLIDKADIQDPCAMNKKNCGYHGIRICHVLCSGYENKID